MMKQFSVVVADFSTEETRKRGMGEGEDRESGGKYSKYLLGIYAYHLMPIKIQTLMY